MEEHPEDRFNIEQLLDILKEKYTFQKPKKEKVKRKFEEFKEFCSNILKLFPNLENIKEEEMKFDFRKLQEILSQLETKTVMNLKLLFDVGKKIKNLYLSSTSLLKLIPSCSLSQDSNTILKNFLTEMNYICNEIKETSCSIRNSYDNKFENIIIQFKNLEFTII